MNNQNIVADNKVIERLNLDTVSNDLKQFYTYLRDKIGCGYITYVYEDLEKNTVKYFSTDPKWQEEYVITGLINNCHIYMNAIENSKKGIYPIIWNFINELTKIQKEVDDYRKSKNIANGIGFLQKNESFRESFSFATDVKNKDFYKHFSDCRTVKSYLDKLRSINTL